MTFFALSRLFMFFSEKSTDDLPKVAGPCRCDFEMNCSLSENEVIKGPASAGVELFYVNFYLKNANYQHS